MSKKFTLDNPADFFISSNDEAEKKVETKEVKEETKEVKATEPVKPVKKKPQSVKKDLSNDYTCYKLSEVASISRLSPRTIQTYVKEGILPATMVGNKWLVSKEDLERLLRGELVKRNKKDE